MENESMNDMDVLRQMYAVLCGGTDRALTLLEEGNVWEAKRVLRQAMEDAEERYIGGTFVVDELAVLREFS